MYKAQNVDVRAGNKTIVRNADATVEPGRITVIIGPNGAGKSTLLKAMTGEIACAKGMISLNGKNIASCSEGELALLRAVLPQSSSLSFPFTVYEVVRLGLLSGYSGLDHQAARQLPRMALERVSLHDFGGKFYQELSGGEQQRVHLARILCQIWAPVLDGMPRYLFLDEPTSNLDMRHQLMILELAREFARNGGGVCAILHDLNIAAMYADEIIAMKDGAIVSRGKPESVFTCDFMRTVFDLPVNVSRIPETDIPCMLPQTVNTEEILRR